ncbi:MAG: response regulator transcription factor [Bacteroidetes bacterium]|nr:response regulator transcription factor [Bacteroidota bacterium]
MPKKILIADDAKDIVEVLKYNLDKEGYEVSISFDGIEAIRKANKDIDLIILDVMMPKLDGIETCKKLKQNPETRDIPIIFLTAKNTEIDEVLGLEIGADDYLIKPVSIRRLLARVKTILRRNEQTEISKEEILILDDIEIDPKNYTVKIKSKEISFPKKEFETLLFLVKNKERIVSREMILDSVWGSDVYVGARTIDVHIRKIREKLLEYGDRIETIKGVGYRFRE